MNEAHKFKENIKDIALARSILQESIYDYVSEDEFLWILDDAMTLDFYSVRNDNVELCKSNVYYYLNRIGEKYDGIIGEYSNHTATPTLSTIRTQLLDYYYYLIGTNKKMIMYDNILGERDYQYDISDNLFLHLETPLYIVANNKNINLPSIFSGQIPFRTKIYNFSKPLIPVNRGGNTLVLNKELLKISNMSIKINNKIMRRGDYLWVKNALEEDYKIVSLPIFLNKNKEIIKFDFDAEILKLKKDMLGYAISKSERKGEAKSKLISRLVNYELSWYRTIGLMQLIADYNSAIIDYQKYWNVQNIEKLKYELLTYIDTYKKEVP